MSRRIHVALFDSEDTLFAAAHACRKLGVEILDVRSPYPLHGIDELVGIRRTRLPAVCLTGGVVGLLVALRFQYWTSSFDWPINVGGKPWDSLPAFAPVAFELTVLVAGLATVFGLLLRSGLLPGRAAALHDPRVTDDHFAMHVARVDAAVTDRDMDEMWQATGAVETRCVIVEEDAR